MFYNQNFDNSYDFDSRSNNCEKDEKRDSKKGYCTVKVIQECCYPSYFDYEDKKDDKRDDCNKHEYKKVDKLDERCCCKHEEKEDYNCCCKNKDKWEDKNSYHNHENNRCNSKQKNSCCGFCSCFRRW